MSRIFLALLSMVCSAAATLTVDDVRDAFDAS